VLRTIAQKRIVLMWTDATGQVLNFLVEVDENSSAVVSDDGIFEFMKLGRLEVPTSFPFADHESAT
jgi:hypothetical protein